MGAFGKRMVVVVDGGSWMVDRGQIIEMGRWADGAMGRWGDGAMVTAAAMMMIGGTVVPH